VSKLQSLCDFDSTTKRKISGESGQPSLNPLSEGKKGEAEPLISTANETVVRQFMTHLMKGTAKPKCVSNKRMKNQLTLS